jgi:flagellar basal-body rod protein FlgC
MAMFGAIDTSGSGLTVYRKWMDAISDNIANINDTTSPDKPAFQERFVVAKAREAAGGADASGTAGVDVVGVQFGDPTGELVSDPTNPLADANGMVRKTTVDLGEQMTSLLIAQRSYQANLAVVERARDAYTAALQIGR